MNLPILIFNLIIYVMATDQQLVSAQVILQPATDTPHQGPVTSKNIAAHLPVKEAAALVLKTFKELGFKTGNLAGISFSITAPAATFEKTFKVKVLPDKKKGTTVQRTDKTVEDHFPVAALPKSIAALVKAIVLPPPPDFGPNSY